MNIDGEAQGGGGAVVCLPWARRRWCASAWLLLWLCIGFAARKAAAWPVHPERDLPLPNQRVAAGRELRFELGLYSHLPIAYQWLKDGKALIDSDRVHGAAHWILTISNVQPSDAGSYMLVASNALGLSTSVPASVDVVPAVQLQPEREWPGAPRGWAISVEVSGPHAFVAAGRAGLMVFDVSDPGRPQRIGGYVTHQPAEDLALIGDRLYLAARESGVLILDVSDPARPRRLGQIAPELEYIQEVEAYGQFVYCLDNGELRIVDVTYPEQPQDLQYPGAGSVGGHIQIAGGRLYLSGWAGLAIFDVSNPAGPLFLGGMPIGPGGWKWVHVAGTLGFLIDHDTGFSTFDLGDPENIVPLGSHELAGITGFQVQGHWAYAMTETNRGWVLDVSDPASPRPVAGPLAGLTGYDLSVTNDFAYVVGADGFRIFAAGDPTNLIPVSVQETSGEAVDLKMANGIACVADGRQGVQVFSAASGASLNWLGRWPGRGGHYALDMAGTYAYVAGSGSNGELEILDLVDPSRPRLIGKYEFGDWVCAVSVHGTLAFVSGYSRDMEIVDVSDPAQPRRLAGLPGVHPARVAVQGSTAVVATGDLVAVDLTDPAQPRELGRVSSSRGSIADVALLGQLAVTAAREGGLQVFDINDPANLTLVGSMVTGAKAERIHVVGRLACLAAGEAGVQVFDLRVPARPALAGVLDTAGIARAITSQGDLLLVADDYQGVVAARLRTLLQLEAPRLADGKLTLSWTGGPGIRLQQRLADEGAGWLDVPSSEGQTTISVPAQGPSSFFRLFAP